LLWRQGLTRTRAAGLLASPHIPAVRALDVFVILNGPTRIGGYSKGLFAFLAFLDSVHSKILRRSGFMRTKGLFIVPLMMWASSACNTRTAPSHLLVGNWSDSARKFATLQMRLAGDARNVTGTACGTTAGYLAFRDAPVEVDGRRVQFVITKESVGSLTGTPLIGNRFVGDLKEEGTIVGRMTGTGAPLNFTLVRYELGSGICEGAAIFTRP
jgi:hypothetical protein